MRGEGVGYLLQQQDLKRFLNLLRRGGSLVAPLRRESDGLTTFEEVKGEGDLERLDLSENPRFSPKKLLMPAYQTLFTYDTRTQRVTGKPVPTGERVLFGLRLCDLNAIRILDELFLRQEYVDDHYRAARESLLLIGWYCNEPPSEWCFCESMNLTNYYDLMMRALPGTEILYLDVGTPRGVLLARRAGRLLTEHTEPLPPIKTRKRLRTRAIRPFSGHPRWRETAEGECLSCERCTIVCPTCLCFDIYDVTGEDLRRGARARTWDSCHSKDFTRVAGNHYFRPDRTARFKHRIYHKLVYFEEVFGTPMCTGCGRCISECPATIDFVKLINEMAAEGER